MRQKDAPPSYEDVLSWPENTVSERFRKGLAAGYLADASWYRAHQKRVNQELSEPDCMRYISSESLSRYNDFKFEAIISENYTATQKADKKLDFLKFKRTVLIFTVLSLSTLSLLTASYKLAAISSILSLLLLKYSNSKIQTSEANKLKEPEISSLSARSLTPQISKTVIQKKINDLENDVCSLMGLNPEQYLTSSDVARFKYISMELLLTCTGAHNYTSIPGYGVSSLNTFSYLATLVKKPDSLDMEFSSQTQIDKVLASVLHSRLATLAVLYDSKLDYILDLQILQSVLLLRSSSKSRYITLAFVINEYSKI